ncbi:hypothetical protein HY312_01120 [Candidatus Saccharibacteria bacterium]|nr:hypothetical protein [Candidatus Saccharibacteria bacterium]
MTHIVQIRLEFTHCGRELDPYSRSVEVPDSPQEARNRVMFGLNGKRNSIVTSSVDDKPGDEIIVTAVSWRDVNVDDLFDRICAEAAGTSVVEHAHAV